MILFCFNKLTAFSIYKRLLHTKGSCDRKSRRSDISDRYSVLSASMPVRL